MRRSGKTTRLVDRLVQEFFENGCCYVYENRKGNPEDSEHTLNIFKKRLSNEHGRLAFREEWGNHEGIWCFKITRVNIKGFMHANNIQTV